MPDTALIVKLAAIGDVVMALPMVTALRASNSAVRVVWLCGASVEPLLSRIAGIDDLIVVDDTRLLGGDLGDRVRELTHAWRVLGRSRFDRVFVAHRDRRYRELVRFVRARDLRTLAGPGRQSMVPGRTHTDEYVRLVTGRDDHTARSFAPPAIDVAIPETLRTRLPADRAIVALAPGGARNPARDNPLRRWPADRYADLARRLVDAGLGVVLTGAKSDDWVRPRFANIPVVDLIGATSLPSLVALYGLCSAVVTHDSGPLHLAGLAGTPRVALFGPTHPSSFVKPGPSVRVLWPAGGTLACAPCYDGREFAACDDNRCMQAIAVDDVFDRVVDVARPPPGASSRAIVKA